MVGLIPTNQTPSQRQELALNLFTSCKTLAEQNDCFRKNAPLLPSRYGQIVWSEGLVSSPPELRRDVFKAVHGFDDFKPENDPYGEHDFGSVEAMDDHFFFKIDYFDPSLNYHSEDKANVEITRRILTIYFTHEH